MPSTYGQASVRGRNDVLFFLHLRPITRGLGSGIFPKLPIGRSPGSQIFTQMPPSQSLSGIMTFCSLFTVTSSHRFFTCFPFHRTAETVRHLRIASCEATSVIQHIFYENAIICELLLKNIFLALIIKHVHLYKYNRSLPIHRFAFNYLSLRSEAGPSPCAWQIAV